MGYGARALQALNAYYSGEYFNLEESSKPEVSYVDVMAIDEVCKNLPSSHRLSWGLTVDQSATLLTDHPTVRPAIAMPPLLQRLSERKPENLDYVGVSYGLTSQLLRSALSASCTLILSNPLQILEACGLCAALRPTDTERTDR
jgi:N-acetyltransferase 10